MAKIYNFGEELALRKRKSLFLEHLVDVHAVVNRNCPEALFIALKWEDGTIEYVEERITPWDLKKLFKVVLKKLKLASSSPGTKGSSEPTSSTP